VILNALIITCTSQIYMYLARGTDNLELDKTHTHTHTHIQLIACKLEMQALNLWNMYAGIFAEFVFAFVLCFQHFKVRWLCNFSAFFDVAQIKIQKVIVAENKKKRQIMQNVNAAIVVLVVVFIELSGFWFFWL